MSLRDTEQAGMPESAVLLNLEASPAAVTTLRMLKQLGDEESDSGIALYFAALEFTRVTVPIRDL